MIKNAATTKAASNTSPGLLLLFYITIGTLPVHRLARLCGRRRENSLMDEALSIYLGKYVVNGSESMN